MRLDMVRNSDGISGTFDSVTTLSLPTSGENKIVQHTEADLEPLTEYFYRFRELRHSNNKV